MKRATKRGEALGQIVQLRRISTRMAERQALLAQRFLRQAEREREEENAHLMDVLAQWDSARGALRFDPLTLSAWGVAVNRQVEAVASSDAAVTQRSREKDAADAAHDRASAAERCADTLLHRARRRISHYREENRIAELDDANARRILAR